MGACLCAALTLAWKELGTSEPRRTIRVSQDETLIREAQGLLDAVQGLEALRHAPAAPNLGALFAVRVHVPATPDRPAPRPSMRLSVDMIIAKGDHGRAIVSGRLTRIGDILPDGSRVVDIQADGVIVRHKGQIRRLPAPSGRILQE